MKAVEARTFGEVLKHERLAAGLTQEELAERAAVACSLEGFALLAAAQGEPARALRLAGAATALRAHAGTPLPPPGELHFRTQLAASWAVLDNDRAAHVYAEGQQLLLGDAVEYALVEDASPHLPTKAACGAARTLELTEREREIAKLVAQGLTNRDIAAQLIVGKRTVDTHIEHVMTKLAVHSHAQIAAWLSRRPPDEPNRMNPSGISVT